MEIPHYLQPPQSPFHQHDSVVGPISVTVMSDSGDEPHSRGLAATRCLGRCLIAVSPRRRPRTAHILRVSSVSVTGWTGCNCRFFFFPFFFLKPSGHISSSRSLTRTQSSIITWTSNKYFVTYVAPTCRSCRKAGVNWYRTKRPAFGSHCFLPPAVIETFES